MGSALRRRLVDTRMDMNFAFVRPNKAFHGGVRQERERETLDIKAPAELRVRV